MHWFWEQALLGVIDAMSGEANEPFGIWPYPPLPKPQGWAKRTLPMTIPDNEENGNELPKLR